MKERKKGEEGPIKSGQGKKTIRKGPWPIGVLAELAGPHAVGKNSRNAGA